MRRLCLAAAIGVVGCGGGSMATTMSTGTAGSGGSSGPAGAGGTTGASGSTGVGGQFMGSSGCSLFTPDDVWNADVSGKPVDAANASKMNALIGAVNIHPDFGSGFGIPITVVPQNQAAVPITFDISGFDPV